MMIFTTRKEAEEFAYGDEVVVKVDGGWAVMKAQDYNVWKEQK